MASFKDRLAYHLKHNKSLQYAYKKIFSSLFRLIGLFVKTKKNLVLINNYGGDYIIIKKLTLEVCSIDIIE